MRKRTALILIALLAAIVMIAGLAACTPGDESRRYTVEVRQNGAVAEAITFTEGDAIDFSHYTLHVNFPDTEESFDIPLTEQAFLPDELSALKSLEGGKSKTMTLRLYLDGETIQSIVTVNILKKPVVKPTYTLTLLLERGYADYKFSPVENVSKIENLPSTHPEMEAFYKITWYRDLSDLSSRAEAPFELESDLTLYGKVTDDRLYTVRFWKDKVNGVYQNQIGGDLSNVKYGEKVFLPTEGLDKDGYRFTMWEKDGRELSVTGAVGEKYFYLYDDNDLYPQVKVIDILAVYETNTYNVSFRYLDASGELKSFSSEFSPYDSAVVGVPHGSALSIGTEFSKTDRALTITAPPKALGEGYLGAWYIDDTRFAENQSRTVRGDLVIVAKYEILQCGVKFYNAAGIPTEYFTVPYGTAIPSEKIPAHSQETGYSFSWDVGEAIGEVVTRDLEIREIKTPIDYEYAFYFETADKELYKGSAPYGSEISLWDHERIKEALGGEFKEYCDYGWYRSAAAIPGKDEALSLTQIQTSGAMRFYLKKKDMRRYTVAYYQQKGADGEVLEKSVGSEVVSFSETTALKPAEVTGWNARSIYLKSDLSQQISDTLSFIPSDWFSESDAREYEIEVVIRYERKTFTLTLYEPDFANGGNKVVETIDGIPFETQVLSVEKLKNYDKFDRKIDGETYRFYGWAKYGSDEIFDLTDEVMTANTDLYAKWIALSEGSYGLEYVVKGIGAGAYAEVVGYDGAAEELIIGSKHLENGVFYPVSSIGAIVVRGKNITAKKITVPASVNRIANAAFVDFYGVAEYEVAEASEAFKTQDGVLYSKDLSTLIAYPLKKQTGEGGFAVPQSVETIAENAFLGYTDQAISFQENSALKEIGKYAFANAFRLQAIALPKSLTTVGAGAFSGAAALSSVVYEGDGLKFVGADAFRGTPFFENAARGALTLGASKKTILRYVGSSKTDYTLADDVISVAAGAFAESEFTSVTAGENSSLEYVGGGAFKNAENLSVFKILKKNGVVEFSSDEYAFYGAGTLAGKFQGISVETLSEELQAKYLETYRGTEYEDDLIVTKAEETPA